MDGRGGRDIVNIHKQFPDLVKDIQFPDFYPKERFFSNCVFRICSQSSH